MAGRDSGCDSSSICTCCCCCSGRAVAPAAAPAHDAALHLLWIVVQRGALDLPLAVDGLVLPLVGLVQRLVLLRLRLLLWALRRGLPAAARCCRRSDDDEVARTPPTRHPAQKGTAGSGGVDGQGPRCTCVCLQAGEKRGVSSGACCCCGGGGGGGWR